ncbi:MAG: outer membrane beta-barrel protein [Candidatus Thiodiazotropha sp.]|jgi:hypothetical protein
MKFLTISIAGGCLLLSSVANAEEPFRADGIKGDRYFGIMASSPQYKEDDSSTSFRAAGLLVRGGKEFNKFLAAEGQFGVFGKDNVDGIQYQIEYQFSIFARGNLPLENGRIRPYGLLGFTRFSGELPGLSNVDDTGMGFGLGIELYGDDRNAVTLEWIRYADGDVNNVDYKLESANIGYVHRF